MRLEDRCFSFGPSQRGWHFIGPQQSHWMGIKGKDDRGATVLLGPRYDLFDDFGMTSMDAVKIAYRESAPA